MRLNDDNSLLLSPSDLNNYVACRHRTALDLRRARGEIKLHKVPRPDADLVAAKGEQHEAAHLDHLRSQRLTIVEVPDTTSLADRVAETEEAMRAGADIVYQAVFHHDGWRGYADFLIRVEEPSPQLGTFSYEVADAKLAKHPKPYFILQLAYYTEQVARIQGRMPELMHLVLGDREQPSFPYRDFDAYVRRVRKRFLEALEAGAEPPYPYPVDHCSYCDWWRRCADKRRADDHLSLVAQLQRQQAIRLEEAQVPTMAALAATPDDTVVPRLARGTLDDLRLQARLQVESRETGQPTRKLLPLEENRGLRRLPVRSDGDVFFDLEGDPYSGDEGLEYLWGSVTADGEYRELWAHDDPSERKAFETWVDWLTDRLREHPDLHVYHYGAYEKTALRRLMSRYGTREAEIDHLLRQEVLVDLYAVVRQALRVGEERYSIKNLERFYGFARDAEVTEAGGSILAYQEYLESRDESKLEAIAAYNADDCRSTLALLDWLHDLRAEAAEEFGEVLPDRDAKPARDLDPEAAERIAELDRLKASLTEGHDEDSSHVLMADLLEYHRRDAKPEWWAYFDRLERSPQELCRDDTEAIGGLELAEEIPLREDARSWVYPLRFPAQQHKMGPGSAVDPEGEKGVKIKAVDDERGILWVARGKAAHGKPLPRAVIPGKPVPAKEQAGALKRLGERVRDHGLEPMGELDAGCDLLTGRAPRIAGPPLEPGPVELERLSAQVEGLEDSALFIQGPPGAGKTYMGGRLIVDLLARTDLRIGVAATSHKAIHNLLKEIDKVAAKRGVDFAGLKKCTEGNPESVYESDRIGTAAKTAEFLRSTEPRLIAGTPWLYAPADMAGAVDILFVDEAGQVALADALAMSQSTRSIVLLGDPQQLAQVSQGTHPRRSGVSVLEHLLAGERTIPPDRGVFLDRTFRMHPDVCSFVSAVMYDGRLESMPQCEAQRVDSPGLSGAGIRHIEVEHDGNRQTSPEEAERIALEIRRLLDGGTVIDCKGEQKGLTMDDILVVVPYNAQVRELKSKLGDAARVGTVDKFQGQEAPVVFFSMTSSSGEDVPRGMDFLFSRNRLNVAVSRAQCLAVVVSSPQLLHTQCSTVEQMRLVNALCRFAEMAVAREPDSSRPATSVDAIRRPPASTTRR